MRSERSDTYYVNPGYDTWEAQEKFDRMVLAWYGKGYEYFTLQNFIGMTDKEYKTWTGTGILSARMLRLMRWQS